MASRFFTTEELVAEFSATMPGFAEAWERLQAAKPSAAELERRIALALSCLEPVYRLAGEKRRRRRPSVGTLILAERVRRALTDDW